MKLLLTNTFPYGAVWATDGMVGMYASNYSWEAEIKFAATTGVYVVDTKYQAEPRTNTPYLTIGMPWSELNNYNEPRGRYTNTVQRTNTIRFPVPPSDRGFFRVRKVS
jgi:hypothetical protein